MEGKRETALSAARIHEEASAPFVASTLKCARLMETDTLSVGHCSMNASAPPPPSSSPCQTSSVTYPPPWRNLVKQVEGPTPVTWQYRPQKQRWTEDKEWKESREDRCKVHDGEGMDKHKGKGGS